MTENIEPVVAVVGAGPAGLFAARELASNGVQVVMFNRDIKPGGLAEYGIYPDKYKMKEGLRKQFRMILADPHIHYFGNVLVGQSADFSIGELMKMGFSAVLVTVGAQATKWLGIPGEDLKGVYHAKDIVYHYNRLPPFSQMQVQIGRKVAVVGAGNVMLDLVRWLISIQHVSEVITIVRRGPAEIKFDKSQLEYVIGNLDWQTLAEEFKRVTPLMKAVGQDPRESFEFFRSACNPDHPALSQAMMRFKFLSSPASISGDSKGNVQALIVRENRLVEKEGIISPEATDITESIEVDTILFAIGDRVDSRIGLPTAGNEFLKNPYPSFPVDGQSFEIFDPAEKKPMEGLFMAGWARKASTGLVGVARKDGTQGASAVLQYLGGKNGHSLPLNDILEKLSKVTKVAVTNQDLLKLEEVEIEEATRRNLPEYKFASNTEMFQAIGRMQPPG